MTKHVICKTFEKISKSSFFRFICIYIFNTSFECDIHLSLLQSVKKLKVKDLSAPFKSQVVLPKDIFEGVTVFVFLWYDGYRMKQVGKPKAWRSRYERCVLYCIAYICIFKLVFIPFVPSLAIPLVPSNVYAFDPL